MFGRLIRLGHWARAEVGRELLVGIVHLGHVFQLFGSTDIFRFACLNSSSRFLGFGRLQRRLLVAGPAFQHRVGNLGSKQANGAQGIIVARDGVIHFVGVTIGIHHRHHRNRQLARFPHGNLLVVGVNDEHGVRQAGHVLHTIQVFPIVAQCAPQPGLLFLGRGRQAAVGLSLLQLLEALDGFLDGGPVGQCAAQPAVVDVEHPAALGLFLNRFLRLAFGADEQDVLALGGLRSHKLRRLFEFLDRLLQVDDVDAVALPENILLHLRVPAPGLMPEVDTRFQQFFHAEAHQFFLPSAWSTGIVCARPSVRASGVPSCAGRA